MLEFAQIFLQVTAATQPYAAEWVSAGSVLIEQVVSLLILVFAIFAVAMQVARGYFLRVLRKFTLRLAADIWWIVFVLLRDAAIFLVLFLGVALFWPGTYQDYAIGVPFMPLGVDFFSFALVLLLLKDTDEDPKANAMLTAFIVIGAALYTIGMVFVTYNPAQLSLQVPTVSTAASNPWGFFYQYFDSINSPTVAIYSFYITLVLLGLAGGRAVRWSYEQWEQPKPAQAKPAAVQK